MNPPTFEGQYEPTEANEWLFRMEDMLEDLDRRRLLSRPVISEDQLVIGGMYVPDSFTFQMGHELGELKQGRSTVAEYTRKFNELVRFLSDANRALTERAKMNKYRYGLRGDIAHAVS
ncbi:hypothetical protein A2U01_0039613, partial [Trifolium medium]|nr:hypothetical protein [Trifolium medium]